MFIDEVIIDLEAGKGGDGCMAFRREKYVEMGRKAKDYYDNHATIQHMARGAIDAFDYVINCKS